MRTCTSRGHYHVRLLNRDVPLRDRIVVTHEGPLQLEVMDPVIRDHVLRLALWDLAQMFPNQVGRQLDETRTSR